MEDTNPNFLVYVVDSRSLGEVREILEQALGCAFRGMEADLPLEERQGEFEAESLGMLISFRQSYTWSIGNVYRLSGSPTKKVYSSDGVDVSLDDHVARALRCAGLQRALPCEQFSELRRQVSESSGPA